MQRFLQLAILIHFLSSPSSGALILIRVTAGGATVYGLAHVDSVNGYTWKVSLTDQDPFNKANPHPFDSKNPQACEFQLIPQDSELKPKLSDSAIGGHWAKGKMTKAVQKWYTEILIRFNNECPQFIIQPEDQITLFERGDQTQSTNQATPTNQTVPTIQTSPTNQSFTGFSTTVDGKLALIITNDDLPIYRKLCQDQVIPVMELAKDKNTMKTVLIEPTDISPVIFPEAIILILNYSDVSGVQNPENHQNDVFPKISHCYVKFMLGTDFKIGIGKMSFNQSNGLGWIWMKKIHNNKYTIVDKSQFDLLLRGANAFRIINRDDLKTERFHLYFAGQPYTELFLRKRLNLLQVTGQILLSFKFGKMVHIGYEMNGKPYQLPAFYDEKDFTLIGDNAIAFDAFREATKTQNNWSEETADVTKECRIVVNLINSPNKSAILVASRRKSGTPEEIPKITFHALVKPIMGDSDAFGCPVYQYRHTA